MEYLFDDNFLDGLKDVNPFIGIQKLCELYIRFSAEKLNQNPVDLEVYNTALNAYSFIYAIVKKWEFQINPVSISGNRRENLNAIMNYISGVNQIAEQKYSTEMIQYASEKYNVMFGNEFFYEISDDDYSIIQKNINELRDLISKSEEIPDNHKDRLIKRIEELQRELNKRVRNFDKFFGVAIEISGYIRQVSENMKPFNDRIKEIVDIIERVMKLATGTFLLESGSDKKELNK